MTDTSLVIVDYPTLQAAIKNTLNRRDLAQEVPVFIRLGEVRLSRDLNTRQMETFIEINTSEDEAGIPNDFMQLLNVQIKDQNTPITPIARQELDGKQDLSGTASYYTLQGNSLLLYPNPGTNTVVQMRYKARIPALTDADPTNWLLDDGQDAYYYATLVQAALFLQDDAAAAKWGGLYNSSVQSINDDAIAQLEVIDFQMQPLQFINDGRP